MDSIRKLVSEGLRAQARASHPDADVLSSFLENSLARAQRNQVIAHLSDCRDCREILYRSLPEADRAQTVLTLNRNRTRLFQLGWASVIAAVGIAAALLTTRYQLLNTRNRPSVATVGQPASTYAKVVEEKAPSEDDRTRTQVTTKKVEPMAQKGLPELKAMQAKPAAKLDFDESGQVHMRKAAPQPAAAAPSREAGNAALFDNLAVSSQENAKRMDAGEPSVVSQTGLQRDRVAAPTGGPLRVAAASSGLAEKNKEEAKSVTVENGVVKFNLQRALSFPAGTARFSWTLSPEGTVLRSLDEGKTWQAVATPQPGPFAALSSVGTHIWIGAKAGTLYHSADSGESWHEVVPAEGDRKLTTDVTRVEFSDPLNGIVVTTGGESWTTIDGGLSWHLK